MSPSRPPPLPADPPARPTTLPRPRGPGGRAWRVLLADDNPVNLQIGMAMLQRLGLEVVTAVDGVEAVQRVTDDRFDLVLMDIQMPRLDGLAATRSIRALPAGQGLPVIAVTANASEQDRLECLGAGMNDVITKPIDIDLLVSTLTRWLPASG